MKRGCVRHTTESLPSCINFIVSFNKHVNNQPALNTMWESSCKGWAEKKTHSNRFSCLSMPREWRLWSNDGLEFLEWNSVVAFPNWIHSKCMKISIDYYSRHRSPRLYLIFITCLVCQPLAIPRKIHNQRPSYHVLYVYIFEWKSSFVLRIYIYFRRPAWIKNLLFYFYYIFFNSIP